MSLISAAAADKPKGVKPSVLSKLWSITEKLAEGAVEQNTQFSRMSAENIHPYRDNTPIRNIQNCKYWRYHLEFQK